MNGLGVDIIETQRIEEAVERFGQRFLNRIFTEGELNYCLPKATKFQCLAARFAAKEAFMKAMGDAITGISFKDIEVVNKPNGRPTIKLHGHALEHIGNRKVMLSLSHVRCCSVAVVLIE